MNKKAHVQIRRIETNDLETIVSLFKDTVHHVNAKDYGSEQLLMSFPYTIFVLLRELLGYR